MKNNDKERDPYKPSPIPKHLTPEERAIWEQDQEWQEKEVERRKKSGLYDPPKYKRKRGRLSSKKKYEMKPFHSQ